MSVGLNSCCALLCKCCLSFQYKIEYSQLRSRQLQISVWHAGALKYRVFLGEVVIPLAAWNFEEDSMQFDWYPLKPKVTKFLCLIVPEEQDVVKAVRKIPPMRSFRGKCCQSSPLARCVGNTNKL